MKKLFMGIYFFSVASHFLFACFLAYLFYSTLCFTSANTDIVKFWFQKPFYTNENFGWLYTILLVPVSMIVCTIFITISFKKRNMLKYQIFYTVWLVISGIAFFMVPEQIYYIAGLYVYNVLVPTFTGYISQHRNLIFAIPVLLLFFLFIYNYFCGRKTQKDLKVQIDP